MSRRRLTRLRRFGAYAIGEVVLIVLGIMIALSLDSWRTGRQERAEERQLLLSLEADYQANLSSIRADREKLNDITGSGALELIQSDSLRIRLSRWDGLLGDVTEDEQRLLSQLSTRFMRPWGGDAIPGSWKRQRRT